MSQEISPSRPYPPTVHALVLPSQIPLDLRLSVRDFDEAWLVGIQRSPFLPTKLIIFTEQWRNP